MLKLLLLAIVVWLLFTILKRYRHNVDQPTQPRPHPEDMVQCAHCQVHLPRSESIQDGALHYCSEAHQQQHQS
ncbi:PP0621 family protein [Methylobacillus methanolivorans]